MNMPSSLPASITRLAGGRSVTPPGSQILQNAPTLSECFNSVRSRKRLVIGLALLPTALVALAVSMMTPVYRSSATILIEQNKAKVVSIEELYGVQTAGREALQTQTEFIRSREVAMRVVNRMDLRNNPLFDPRQVSPRSMRARLAQYGFLAGMAEPTPAMTALGADEVDGLVLERFKEAFDVVPVRLSQLVEIRFESSDPVLAAEVANQAVDAYVTADLDARFTMQQTASKWLNERLVGLRTELEASERQLQAYREASGLVATPTGSASMGGNVRQMDASAERLIAARVERSQAEQVFNQVSQTARNRYEVPAVLNNPSVVSARELEAKSEQRLSEVGQNLGSAHPEYKSAQADLKSARDNTRRQAEGVISSIAKAYEVAKSTERAIERALEDSKGDIRDINRKEGKLNVLEREVATNQQVYQTFLGRVKETDATADFRNPIARIIDPAVPALEPVSPKKSQLVLLTALLSLLLASALAILIERRSAVIRSSEEVSEKLGVPLIAAVPMVAGEQKSRLATLQKHEPRSLFAESVRSAQTGVRLALIDVARPVVMFTSALPGEGKSTLALNFAIEQARTKRTLLIDADMRKPSLSALLGVSSATAGLSELLAGEPVNACVQRVEDLNLSVICSGQRLQNPHDLLLGPRFAEMLAELRSGFDLIVIDSPPLELVSDALPIGLHTSGVIFVLKGNATPVQVARRSLDRIISANIPVLGVLLNSHDFERAGKYFGEYSAHAKYGKEGYYGAVG